MSSKKIGKTIIRIFPIFLIMYLLVSTLAILISVGYKCLYNECKTDNLKESSMELVKTLLPKNFSFTLVIVVIVSLILALFFYYKYLKPIRDLSDKLKKLKKKK